ncbi:MAG: LPS export ABC transporter periplasmic protein LptC [Gammaproteobacteria bacterium]
MTSRIVGLVVVLALVIGTLMLSRGPSVESTPATAEEPLEAPGYAARNAEVVETGDDGRPLYTLNAELVRQHPNDNRIQLDAPRMTFIASDGNPWHVRARSGQIREGGANVELFGDVHLNGELPGAAAPAVVDTSILSFDTKKEVVTTHAPVTLDWNGKKLAAVGLTANLNDHQLKLESRIHGTFNNK